MPTVILAENAGFCWGVERALDRVREAAAAAGPAQPVTMHGPVIHNPQVVEELVAQGVRLVGSLDEVGPGSKLVIRAHGITPEQRQAVQSFGLVPVDGTCPHVGMIQGEVKRYIGIGWHVVIVGSTLHPEVVGLLGFTEGRGHVVRNPEDVAGLPEGLGTVAVVSQSTETRERFMQLAALLRERYGEDHTVVVDTRCDVTDRRQLEIPALAALVDAIVVVGGHDSANTRHMAELAERTGRPAFHIEVPEELDADLMRGFETVGLTAGASTPASMIQKVKARLEELGQNGNSSEDRS